jgi:ABC-type antimicrobial peptide transport system permease subunit
LVSLLKQPGIGFLIAGVIITAIGLFAASGGQADTWEIMGRTIPSTEWGLPFAIVGILFLLIGAILTYYHSRKKE